MSYTVSVPLISRSAERMGLEAHLKELERLNASRVMLSINRYFLSEEEKTCELAALKRNVAFFKSHGYEVCAWLWTFMLPDPNTYTHMRGVSGAESKDFICPSDPDFRRMAGSYLADVAACGVDMILFDDDFRYGTLPHGLGCVCKNHIAYMEEELGETIDTQKLCALLLSGSSNRYRAAWQRSKRHFFEVFAKEMRASVDKVNPKVRIGVCACITTWDMDGIDAASIARLLAGGTKPFLRLIGAPYWAEKRGWGCHMQDIIELERMENSWCTGEMEIVSEGDVYPRPRTACPASYLELFDTALRADGHMSGILKYGIDYNSRPGYESGYIESHEKHRAVYASLAEHFDGKVPCGVRVYERMEKFEDMRIPRVYENRGEVENIFFSRAARLVSSNSLPTVYEGTGVCGVAFAENVTMVPREAYQKGLILDLRAAQILTEQGIDVGLLSVGESYHAAYEYFDTEADETYADLTANEITVSDKAEIFSHFMTQTSDALENHRTIGSYYYRNAEGEQFFVLAWEAYEQAYTYENVFRSYYRSHSLYKACARFGAAVPAYSYGHPELYILTKREETTGALAVGLWNCFADEIVRPVVELDAEYRAFEGVECTGTLDGKRVTLSSIPPFSCAFFTVKKG